MRSWPRDRSCRKLKKRYADSTDVDEDAEFLVAGPYLSRRAICPERPTTIQVGPIKSCEAPAMYQHYWGLRESPFRGGLEPSVVSSHGRHEESLARMNFLVEQRRRLGLLAGRWASANRCWLEVFGQQIARPGVKWSASTCRGRPAGIPLDGRRPMRAESGLVRRAVRFMAARGRSYDRQPLPAQTIAAAARRRGRSRTRGVRPDLAARPDRSARRKPADDHLDRDRQNLGQLPVRLLELAELLRAPRALGIRRHGRLSGAGAEAGWPRRACLPPRRSAACICFPAASRCASSNWRISP